MLRAPRANGRLSLAVFLLPTMPHTLLSPPRQQQVVVRQVWAWNLRFEFSIIASILPHFHFVAVDTEFPGCIFRSATPYAQQSADTRYSVFKSNVDSLKLIQLGLSFFDADGNLPDSVDRNTGAKVGFVWEFNFQEFDVRRDPHNPDSIALLRSNGIDFDRLRFHGIHSADFAAFCYGVGLVSHCRFGRRLSTDWVAFSCCYDFGYLVKVLTNRALPRTQEQFTDLVEAMFGKVIDIKNLMYSCDGLYGGLETVAKTLGITREAGRAHQAGSDVLLTYRVFLKIKKLFFQDKNENLNGLRGTIPF